MNRGKSALGVSALLTEVLFLNFVLLWLRARPNGSAPEVLAIGNLMLGCLVFLPGKRTRELQRPPVRIILLWSLSYCITYGAFVWWPHLLPLSVLRIAQTVAPMAAVFITGDWRSDRMTRLEIVLTIAAIGSLIAAVLIQSTSGIGMVGVGLFVCIAVCYIGSQTAARLLSKAISPLWTSIHLSLSNGIILTGLLIPQGHFRLSASIAKDALILAVFIPLVQAALLVGLRLAPPLLAGLCLAVAVPCAVIWEAMASRLPIPKPMLAASMIFVLLLAALSILKRRRSDVPLQEVEA
jgi:preprotein translocase subunit SecG